MAHSRIARQEDGFFLNRLRRLLDSASLNVHPADLAHFLMEPNTIFGNHRPWNLIMEPSDEEFECLLARLRRKAKGKGTAP